MAKGVFNVKTQSVENFTVLFHILICALITSIDQVLRGLHSYIGLVSVDLIMRGKRLDEKLNFQSVQLELEL